MITALLCWLLSVSAPGVSGGGLAVAGPAATEHFKRGDRLAREKKYADALEAWREGYLVKLPDYRGLQFLHPVTAEIMPRKELGKRMLEELAKEYPDAKVEADSVAFAAFGFWPKGFDLKGVTLRILSEQIAGFYDPDTKQLYLINEDGSQNEERSWISKLVGGSGFNPSEQKTILAHELSHALMDQYFDLYSLHRSFQDDEDAAMAISGLIEGEATLSMMVDGQGTGILGNSPGGAAGGFLDFVISASASLGGGGSLDEAPLYMRESLLFPYMKGLYFCWDAAAKAGGQWDAVNAAFNDPPISTEQILHPEKYLASPEARDMPLEILLPAGGPFDPAAWETVKENVLGEFQTDLLFREKQGAKVSSKAAAGWGGDVYRVLRNKTAPAIVAVIWASQWDTAKDADELLTAAKKHFATRKLGGLASRKDGARVTMIAGKLDEALRREALDWASRFSVRPKKIDQKKLPSEKAFAETSRRF